jgi:Tfp pilus assembly protein PilN
MRAVNLIPSEQRSGSTPGAGRSEGGAYAVLALLGGLAIMALLYGIAHHQIASRRTQTASLAVQVRQAQEQAAQLAPYTSFIALREQRMQAVSELVDARFDWAHAFHELGRVLPGDASISSLSGTVGSASPTASSAATTAPASTTASATGAATSSSAASAAVTSATPAGSVPTFTLSGCATSQSEVALTLNRLRLIDGVSEVTLQSSTKSASTGGSGGGSGGCAGGDPAFTVLISFDPLPAASALGSSSSTTASVAATTEPSKARSQTATGGA